MEGIFLILEICIEDKDINFGITHIHRCVLALYTQYFPELCEQKNHRHITWSGFEPTTFLE